MQPKLFTLLFLFIFSGINAHAQTCASLHKGKFRLRDEQSGTTIITRTEKYQTEVAADFNIVFSITWVSECTYELRPVKVIKGDQSILDKGFVITVDIIDVRKHGYKAVVSNNTSDASTFTCIIEQLE